VGGAGGPVASLVASGLRAFVVASGLPPGVLEPGDRVDVIATFGGPRPYTDTVGTGLEVLSIVEEDAGTFQAAGPSGPSLVLLVSAETAEQLAHATAFGRITVTVAPPDA
jgi:Flp pilus assembly protein CpaB